MTLDFYREPVGLSDPAGQARLFDGLPAGPAKLAGVVQGLLMHEHVAPAYGLNLSPAKHAEAHVRAIEAMLDSIAAHDRRPLTEARAPAERQVGVCRHFALMHVAMLRHQGVPARARCGFGAYFEKGKYVDHWVTEYWSEGRNGWLLVDPQLDARQRELFRIAFDPLDVPRDQFLVAGDAWTLCRSGKADAKSFGILDMWGLWFIGGNVVRDFAALNKREMLPWDGWGAMTPYDADIDLALIDKVAALTREPDRHFEELCTLYHDDRRLGVPAVVFNHVLNRQEAA
jgi:hypothetical protein